MNRIILYALATGLLAGAGCSKQEESAPASKGTVAEKAQILASDVTQKAEGVAAQATEQLTAAAERTKVAAQDLSQKAQTAIKELTVSKDDVMAELSVPVSDVKTKVASLGQSELMAYAGTYKDVLLEKKDQLAGLTSQLKALPMGDMFGEKAKAIKDQLSQYTSQLAGLKERYGIYLDKLKALGADLSAFGL